MKQFIYNIKSYGWKIVLGNWLIEKGGNMIGAKSIDIDFFDEN
jgi:hypothetical protein|tara:strand:- start:5077 stop:5205 length:129 start_codon:yes stop_codon:yes gene_type:complete